jgi:16S rRNA (cytidine1402-2'-O)-methyltransferase
MKLFIVATPIGNLKDVSERALETLRNADAILCEDTRVTAKLLAAYEIKKPLFAYHQHTEAKRLNEILSLLQDGKSLALVTDAGTPAISDPGGMLVAEAVRKFGAKLEVIPIPGPSALIAALSISGFPADEFVFLGFPPHKKGRKTFFERIAHIESTLVFYESTHRILKTLVELEGAVQDRAVVVCRELTKLHESVYRGTAREVTAALQADSIKGEFVVVVCPKHFSSRHRSTT